MHFHVYNYIQHASMLPKHGVAPVTARKQLFRQSRLECKTRRAAGTHGCWWSSWLVEGSAVVSVWLMTFPEDCASCEGLARRLQKKVGAFSAEKRDVWLAAGFTSWPDFSRCKTNKSSDCMQIKNSEEKKKHNLEAPTQPSGYLRSECWCSLPLLFLVFFFPEEQQIFK